MVKSLKLHQINFDLLSHFPNLTLTYLIAASYLNDLEILVFCSMDS